MTDLIEALTATPVIAILRSGSSRRFPDVADVLHASGIRAVEFTLSTPAPWTHCASTPASSPTAWRWAPARSSPRPTRDGPSRRAPPI